MTLPGEIKRNQPRLVKLNATSRLLFSTFERAGAPSRGAGTKMGRLRRTDGVAASRAGTALLLAALACSGTALALTGDAAPIRITQKGRAFAPGSIAMTSGQAIEIVNDDGELVHHAYLESPDFSFDTGEQAPGSRTVVVFPRAGKFTVMCGIHPKMKLHVFVK